MHFRLSVYLYVCLSGRVTQTHIAQIDLIVLQNMYYIAPIDWIVLNKKYFIAPIYMIVLHNNNVLYCSD